MARRLGLMLLSRGARGLAAGGAAGFAFSLLCCAMPFSFVMYQNQPGRTFYLFLPFGVICGAAGGATLVAVALLTRAGRPTAYGLLGGLLAGAVAAQALVYMPVFPAILRPRADEVVPWQILAFPGAVYGLVGALAAWGIGRQPPTAEHGRPPTQGAQDHVDCPE